MEDKVIELTRFIKLSEAEMLVTMLKSEGIDCYVRDGYMNQIYGGADIGGVKVELLEKDLQRAKEIMKVYGYASSERNPAENSDSSEETTEDEVFTKISETAAQEEILDISETEESDAETLEDKIAAYKRQKARLSRTMYIGCALIIIVLTSLILLNKYYNG